jgi:hypothetical protein
MSDDSYTEVTYTSWFQRLGGAIRSVLLGAILFVVSFPLLFWNEGRAVNTARGLAEGQQNVVSVAADRVDPANEGKLVHISGQAAATQSVTDSEFGVSAPALRLERVVWMYQWREKSETQSQKKLGGGEEKKITYTYEREWSREAINSGAFKVKEGHQNPSTKRFVDKTETAEVRLGVFELPTTLAAQITASEPFPVDESARNKLHAELRDTLKVHDGRFYAGNDPARPEVGDLKVEFRVVKPTTVSVVAEQTRNTLRPYQPRSGNPIALLSVGTHSAKEMFQKAESGNTLMTWGLRLGGYFLMALGVALVFRPLVVIADVLPILGDFLGMGVAIFAGLIAVPLTLVTIAIGWIVYRPLLGAGLLVAAAAGIAVLFVLRRKRKPPVAVAAGAIRPNVIKAR